MKGSSAKETQPLLPTKNVDAGGSKQQTGDQNEETETPSIQDDAFDTIRLGIPIFIARLSFVGVSVNFSFRFVFRACAMYTSLHLSYHHAFTLSSTISNVWPQPLFLFGYFFFCR